MLKFVCCGFNAYAINEFYESPVFPLPPPTKSGSLPKIGSALYSFHSLFNHACDGNVCAAFHKDILVSRSVAPIKAGEQVRYLKLQGKGPRPT